MTRLILTADGSSAGGLQAAGRADIVIAIEPRFVWGQLLSDTELAAMFGRADDPKARLALARLWIAVDRQCGRRERSRTDRSMPALRDRRVVDGKRSRMTSSS